MPQNSSVTAVPGMTVKLAYSVGNLGKSVVLTTFDTCLLYYLVRIAGFAPLLAGALLTAVMVWDGCADLAVAWAADRHGKANALGRLVVVGAPLCGISFWLIFADLPTAWRFVAPIAVMLCRVGYSLCDIGHNTLLVRIATNARDAAMVSGIRLVFSAMGAGLVGLAVRTILSSTALDQPAQFGIAAMAGGAIYGITLLAGVRATRALPVTTSVSAAPRVARTLGALWNNPQFRLVLLLIAIQSGLLPLFNRALPFLGEARFDNAGWGGTALTAIALAQALSLPAWMVLARTRTAFSILALSYGIMILALTVLWGALFGVRSDALIVMIGLGLLGGAQAGMNLAIWALLATSVRQGLAVEALPVGVFLVVLKTSAGLGQSLLAASLAFAGGWCPSGPCHGTTPTILAAIVLPLLGCGVALALVMRHSQRAVTANMAP